MNVEDCNSQLCMVHLETKFKLPSLIIFYVHDLRQDYSHNLSLLPLIIPPVN